MPAKPLVLVDGSSYLFRAYHALPALSSSRGEPTGAILGVLNMLYKLLEDYAPEHIAVIFDAPGKTFRDALYAEYKAHRPPTPEDLKQQIEPLIAAVEASGIPVLRVDGVEADDVIGTLANRAAARGHKTVISTSDKDMAQLVDENVTLVNTMSNTSLDTDGVIQKFGVRPEQIVDFLALTGDTSDNIPGVPGVGPKTAAKWLGDYETLDAIVDRADEIPGKAGENLRATLEHLPLYRKLATIVCDLDLDIEPEELALGDADDARLRQLYERLELKSLMRRVGAHAEADGAPARDGSYETVLTHQALEKWLERVEAAALVALDTETTSLNYMEAEIVGISVCVKAGEAAYIPLAHRYPGAPEQLDRDAVLERMRAWLESARPKLGHHLKYDAHVFANHGIALGGMAYDSMLESFVLNSTATRHDLDSVAAKYLEYKTTTYEEVAGKGAKQLCFDEVDIETAAPYAAEDADVSLRLHETLWTLLEKTPELKRVYIDIEQPLVPVLQRMEYLGVLVDADMLREQSQELAEAMAKTEAMAHKEAGGPFNLASPKQLQEILYERLGCPCSARPRKVNPRPPRACCRISRATTSYRG